MPGAARSADLSRSTLADLGANQRSGGRPGPPSGRYSYEQGSAVPSRKRAFGLADDLGEATYPDRVEVGEGLLFVVGSRRVSLPLG
jgi:hypothetical protein